VSFPHRILATIISTEGRVERLLSKRLIFGPLVLLVAVAFGIRWALVTLSVPTVGPDYGHYLIGANWYAGVDRTGEGPFDPPFVPLLILALVPLVGTITTLQLLGPIALVSLFVAAVFFLERFVPRWAAVVSSAVFVQWQTFSEFITSGGITNLFGIAFALVFFRLFDEALARPLGGWRPRRLEILASAILFLIASTHHFTTLIMGATVLAWCAIHLVIGQQNRRASIATMLRVLVPGTALSVVYIPYFLTLIATDAQSGLGRSTSPSVLIAAITFSWQSTPLLWAAFLGLAASSFLRLRRSTSFAPTMCAIALTPFLLELTVLASHPVRTLFFLEFPLVFLGLSWLNRREPSTALRFSRGRVAAIASTSCVVLLAVALVVLPGSGEARMVAGIGNYHSFMNVYTIGAFDWVRAHTATTATFAVDAAPSAAYNNLWMGLATGWWLEGYANRKAIYESNLPLLPFSARWDNVRDANRLFAGDTVFEDGVLRVADGFPFDDAAAPKVYTGYFLDFHDFVGFAVPRLVNSTTGQAFTLVLGADPRYDRGLANDRGWVSGNYSGPGFTATRIAVYDYASTTVSLSLTFAFVPASPWDAFEMTIRVPPWTQLNLARLDQQTIDAQIPDVAGSGMEAGSIAFVSSNLSSATEVPQIGSPGEMGVGLRWKILNSAATFEGRIFLTKFPTSGPPRHAPFMKSADQILSERTIDFLFISMDSISDIQRFDRQASRFERAFANAGVVIFRVI